MRNQHPSYLKMAYPCTLYNDILKTYQPSPNLEPPRKIRSENFDWNINHPKSLSCLCVIVITNNWPDKPIVNLPLRKDNDLFFQMLDTNISLQLLTDSIKDDIFWKRAYMERWKAYKLQKEKTWIQAYIEKHYAEVLENMHPKSYDPEKIMRLVSLCSPFIQNLSIKSLVPVDPLNLDRNTSPEMSKYLPVGDNIKRKPVIVKEFIRDHIPLQAVLGNLPHLVELHLTFQLRNTGAAFCRDAFQCTNADTESLAKGLEKCTQLRTLRVTRSDVNCSQVKYILRALSDHTRLYCLDFSHCSIAEEGALYIAKYVSKKENVKSLILVNNKFSVQGAEGLSYALNHPGCGLRILDLRLNTRMGSDGVAHIALALARGCNLHSINLSGCGIQPGPLRNPPSDVWFATSMEHAPSCGELLARAIGLGRTPLRSFDISVNNLGIDVGDALANSICLSLLVDVHLRRCGISSSAAAIGESAAAAQKLRREAEKGVRFRRSAGRVLQARRVAKGMNIDTDLVLFAQQLSARPSIVSFTSEEGTYNVQALPQPTDFGFVPSFKDPLPSSRASSLTGPLSSRRSSHHQVLEPVKETRRSALVRRGSDGSLLHAKSAETQRRIKIFVCNNDIHSEAYH